MKKILILSSIASLYAFSANAQMVELPTGNVSDLDQSILTITVPADASNAGSYYWNLVSGRTLTIDQNATFDKVMPTTTMKTGGVTFNTGETSNIIISEGKTLTIKRTSGKTDGSETEVRLGNVTLNKNAVFSDQLNDITRMLGSATLSIGDGATFKAARLRLEQNTVDVNGYLKASVLDLRGQKTDGAPTINMNKAFAITTTNGSYSTEVMMMISNKNGKLNMNVNASQMLGNLTIQENTSASDVITMTFANNAVLTFNGIYSTGESGREFGNKINMVLTDFTNSSLFFKNEFTLTTVDGKEAIAITTTKDGTLSGETGYIYLSGTDTNKKALSGFSLVEGSTVDANGATVDGWWLQASSIQVPEPAEWAAILGALALGLAVYRKRK